MNFRDHNLGCSNRAVRSQYLTGLSFVGLTMSMSQKNQIFAQLINRKLLN